MSAEHDDLQEMVLADARKIYTETAIDHFMHPRNLGKPTDYNGYASITGSCGDNMEILITVWQGRITKVHFMTDGCGTSVASGSMATVLAAGKTTAEVLRISQQDILDALGGLPEESRHCALLASNALKDAVQDYLAVQRDPWKRAYHQN